MPKQNPVVDKSFAFALKVIELYKYLTLEKKEYVLSKQFLRSGTSIGANVNEAIEAQSKADFIHKLSIALKEARETNYWVRLLIESNYLTACDAILSDSTELIRILTAIIKTSKENK
ncbi:MAG: four helix bundle protein [Candidatus Cloacimonadaceae bacterium]|nr:four helix bundle protein [Candidatus Cloacimonadaceae bacterium]